MKNKKRLTQLLKNRQENVVNRVVKEDTDDDEEEQTNTYFCPYCRNIVALEHNKLIKVKKIRGKR